jgi:hypothetical protein
VKDPPIFTQIWIFWFENKPSGNPGVEQFLANDVTSSLSDEIITLIT